MEERIYVGEWALSLIILLPLSGVILNSFLLSWGGYILDLIFRWIINRVRLLGLFFKSVDKLLSKKYPDREKLPGIRSFLLRDEVLTSVSLGVVFTSFLLGLVLWIFHLNPLLEQNPQGFIKCLLWNWVIFNDENTPIIEVAFRFDRLSFIMIMVVTGVGFLIHLYSVGYMGSDKGYRRFFIYMNLFIFFMLVLVMADNLLVMFIGWEGVGLCSYLLIGFWYSQSTNAQAAKKAFIINRIGDAGFIIGMLIIAYATNSLEWVEIEKRLNQLTNLKIGGISLSALASLALFLGAIGKSAQFPLYVWLPDAMVGPTPVSALIHAATMVTVGVYMVVRLNFLYLSTPSVLAIVGGIGAGSALFSAIIATTQNDIKKVLAYSTISQLGYMFIGVGVGAFTGAIFHLVTHSFFKACLFLCAGVITYALKGIQDIRYMGGIKRGLPLIYWSFFSATLAIMGIPPTSGFFSKDDIIVKAYFTQLYSKIGDGEFSWLSNLYFVIGVVTSFITSFYMIRLFMLVFEGKEKFRRNISWQLHNGGFSMLFPILVLAFLSIFGGVKEWLEGAIPEPEFRVIPSKEIYIVILSIIISISGAYLAYTLYREPSLKKVRFFSTQFPFLYRLVYNRFWIDELFDLVIVRPMRFLANLLYKFIESLLIDGLVNLLGYLTLGISEIFRLILHGNGKLQRYVAYITIGFLVVVLYLGYPVTDIQAEMDTVGGLYIRLPAYPGYKFKLDFDGDGRWDEEVDFKTPTVYHKFNPGIYNIKIEITSNWGLKVLKNIRLELEE